MGRPRGAAAVPDGPARAGRWAWPRWPRSGWRWASPGGRRFVSRALPAGRDRLYPHPGRGGLALGVRAGHDAPPASDCRGRHSRVFVGRTGRAGAVPVAGPGLPLHGHARPARGAEDRDRGASEPAPPFRRDSAGDRRRGAGIVGGHPHLLLPLRRGDRPRQRLAHLDGQHPLAVAGRLDRPARARRPRAHLGRGRGRLS